MLTRLVCDSWGRFEFPVRAEWAQDQDGGTTGGISSEWRSGRRTDEEGKLMLRDVGGGGWKAGYDIITDIFALGLGRICKWVEGVSGKYNTGRLEAMTKYIEEKKKSMWWVNGRRAVEEGKERERGEEE